MRKKIAGFVAAVMVALVGFSNVTVAEATDVTAVIPDKVVYESGHDMTELWKTKTAPEKEGYVFGGWFEMVNAEEEGTEAVTDEEANTIYYKPLKEEKLTDGVEGAVAKFVPAYVLSVKAQIDSATTGAGDEKAASIRVMSSVDSKNYQKVGFEIRLNNGETLLTQDDGAALETTRAYTGLQVGETVVKADKIFGTASVHLSVWRLDGIIDANDAKIINVRPYWVTLDGTTVKGLAKYVHIEDGYNHYVSVPINLCDADAKVAAGVLQMSYDSAKLALVSVEYDGVFPQEQMAYSDKGDAIKFVGNGDVVGTAEDAEGIYANVRFKLIDESYKVATRTEYLKFAVTAEDFSDWEETEVTINAWDIQY